MHNMQEVSQLLIPNTDASSEYLSVVLEKLRDDMIVCQYIINSFIFYNSYIYIYALIDRDTNTQLESSFPSIHCL